MYVLKKSLKFKILPLRLQAACYRSDGGVIRIISARKANAREIKSYP
jgi:uncharacterized DUF497 family protein